MPKSEHSPTAVIIGGNAAGMSAASKLKREAPGARAIVFERSPHVSYSACGIPYWLEGAVAKSEDLLAIPQAQIRAERGIEIFTRHEAVAVDPRQRNVYLRNLETGREFTAAYDCLLLATGAKPIVPPWPGHQASNVVTLRSLADGIRLQQKLSDSVQTVAIIGAGYVGLELTAALRSQNRNVILVEKSPRILAEYEPEIAAAVTSVLTAHGVTLYTGIEVTGFESDASGAAIAVQTKQAPARIAADLFLVAIGIRPEVELARSTGIHLGETGAIATSPMLQTNYPEIFAAGDCIEITHQLTGVKVWLPLGPAANKQGRVAGQNMAGGASAYWGAIGTAVFKTFEIEVACTGLKRHEAEAFASTVAYTAIEAHDIAGYLPEARKMQVVLIHEKRSGRLLGAQLAGFHGVGKRIDVIATALTAKMTIGDLAHLDLSYAPPVAPVWDPILVAANVALQKSQQREHKR